MPGSRSVREMEKEFMENCLLALLGDYRANVLNAVGRFNAEPWLRAGVGLQHFYFFRIKY